LVLSGPTAIGKTNLSLELARRLNGEIISADSVQIFRGMDIGTDKVGRAERERIPHHLLDLVSPNESFSAYQFWEHAHQATNDILSRGKVPIVVGGSGFYLNWYLHKKARPAQITKPPLEVAQRIKKMIDDDRGDWNKSIARVQAIDPAFAATIAVNDVYRIVRALEIHAVTGLPPSSFASRRLAPWETLLDFRCVYFTSSDSLATKSRIDLRCEEMVERGLLEETMALLYGGLETDSTPAKAIGYSEAISFLLYAPMGSLSESFADFLTIFQNSSRRYARRQRTWFRREPLFCHWLYRNEMGESDLLARTTDLYSMPFADYMDTFDWETYLDAMAKDYRSKSMHEYATRLQIFASAASRSHFLASLAPRIRDLRQWYTQKEH
jgi:tRNA dimethylallyltransferase